MIRKIVGVKDERLRKRSKKVTKIDKKVKSLIKDLKDTLEAQVNPEGVGLAAPQVGKNLRIFITKYKNSVRVFINPKIIHSPTEKSKNKTTNISKDSRKSNLSGRKIMEGCLSLPNFYGPLKRDLSVKIEYLGQNGKQKKETLRGFEAQIVQHEVDHLNGVLFIDRLLQQKKPLYELVNDEWHEVEI